MLVDARAVDGGDEKSFSAGQVIEGAVAEQQIALGHAVEFDEALDAAKSKLSSAQAEYDAALALAGSRATASVGSGESTGAAVEAPAEESAIEAVSEQSGPSQESVAEQPVDDGA